MNGSGFGQIAWTPQAFPLSVQTQTKVSALKRRVGWASGPGLLTRPVPVQKSWRWTWRVWCSGVSLSYCGASVRARNTATHTAAPGYDPCPPERASALRPPSAPPAGQEPSPSLPLEWTKRTLAWEPMLLLPLRWLLQCLRGERGGGLASPEPSATGSLGLGHPPRHFL